MSDATIQGYIQTLIQADALFDAADVTLGDFLALERGSMPVAVVLPGRIVDASRSGDWSQVLYVWEHVVEVFEDFVNDSYSDFTSARQAVLDAIAENPTLGGHIGNAFVSEATPPIYLRDGGEEPLWVFSRVTVRSIEEVLYAGSGEFA
jgi:hypothetical protein